MYEEALEAAKALDEEFKRTKKVKGPLHGVPFSLKDQCASDPAFPFWAVV